MCRYFQALQITEEKKKLGKPGSHLVFKSASFEMNGLPWCLEKVAILSKRYTCQRREEEIVTFKAMRGKLKKNK